MPQEFCFVNYSTGNDGSAGNEGAPFKTIQKGVNEVAAGGEVILRGGTHLTTTLINCNNMANGSNGNPTTIRNYTGEDVTIQRTSGTTNSIIHVGTNNGNAKSYITITGEADHPLILDGNSKQADGGINYTDPSSGQHSNIVVAYFTIQNCDGSGMLTGKSKDGWIHHGLIDDVGTEVNHDHCIYSSKTWNTLFEDLELTGAIARGFQVHSSSDGSLAVDNVFRRLYSHHNGAHGGMFNVGSRHRVENSIFAFNGSTGFSFNDGSNGSMWHCILYKNNQDSSANQLVVASGYSGATIRNSIILNGVNGNYTNSGSGTVQSNNIGLTSTPTTGTAIWTDPDNEDFSLKNTAGTPAAAVTTYLIDQAISGGIATDYAGNARPQGASNDIGHLEWGDTAPPDGPNITNDASYVVTREFTPVTITITKGTNNVVEATVSTTGKSSLSATPTNVTVVRN